MMLKIEFAFESFSFGGSVVARSVSPSLPVGNWGGLKLLQHHVFFLKLRTSPFQFTARSPQFPISGYFGVGQEEAERDGGGYAKGHHGGAVQTPGHWRGSGDIPHLEMCWSNLDVP